MQVSYMDKSYSINHDKASLEGLFSEIGKILADKQIVLAGMIIDGVEIYDGYEEYIADRLDKIENLEVIFDTMENSIDDILISMSKYIDRAVPELESLVDDFYTGEVENVGIERLGQLSEGIHWIINMVGYVDGNKALHSVLKASEAWNECVLTAARLCGEYDNFKEAVGNMDVILIADILKYEITDIFMVLNRCIGQIYGHGVGEDVN